jgi:hypothetical protein
LLLASQEGKKAIKKNLNEQFAKFPGNLTLFLNLILKASKNWIFHGNETVFNVNLKCIDHTVTIVVISIVSETTSEEVSDAGLFCCEETRI